MGNNFHQFDFGVTVIDLNVSFGKATNEKRVPEAKTYTRSSTVCACVCVCVCVCVCASACVCVCVCVHYDRQYPLRISDYSKCFFTGEWVQPHNDHPTLVAAGQLTLGVGCQITDWHSVSLKLLSVHNVISLSRNFKHHNATFRCACVYMYVSHDVHLNTETAAVYTMYTRPTIIQFHSTCIHACTNTYANMISDRSNSSGKSILKGTPRSFNFA